MIEVGGDRLKRLKMRSWRRGTKEMDLILGPFADARVATLSDTDLDVYDRLLSENDQDLYLWVTGRAEPPAEFAGMIAVVGAFSGAQGRVG